MKKTLMMGLMDEIHHRSLCLCPPPAATKRQARSGTYGSRGPHFAEAQGSRDETSRARPRTRWSIHCEVTGEKGTK
jgi:hypothetical protein